MIDVHCHVLFGVDDGASTIDDSLRMIEVAIQNGMTKMICTPHLIPGHRFEINDFERLNKNFQILKEAVQERGYPMECYLGAEFQASDAALPWITEKKIVTLNGTNRVLVELPWHYQGVVTHTEEFYLQMMIDQGYRVLIAHPERYKSIMEDFDTIKRWKAMGCAFQVNSTSLIPGETIEKKELAWRLIDEGYCDVIASDAHASSGTRINNLMSVYQEITKRYSGDLAAKLCITNPNKCISGEDFE